MSKMFDDWRGQPLGEVVRDRLRQWTAGTRTTDPWSREIDDGVRGPDAAQVCHRCLRPAGWGSFCAHCCATVGATINIDPPFRIFPVGEVARSGVDPNARFTRLTALGYVLFAVGEYGFFCPIYFARMLTVRGRIRRSCETPEAPTVGDEPSVP